MIETKALAGRTFTQFRNMLKRIFVIVLKIFKSMLPNQTL